MLPPLFRMSASVKAIQDGHRAYDPEANPTTLEVGRPLQRLA